MNIDQHLSLILGIYVAWLVLATLYCAILARKHARRRLRATLMGFVFAINPLFTPIFIVMLKRGNPFERRQITSEQH